MEYFRRKSDVYLLIVVSLCLFGFTVSQNCEVPEHFWGQFYSIETGEEVNTLINLRYMQNEKYNGYCVSRKDVNGTGDAWGRFDSRILFLDEETQCYKCYHLFYRSPNIVQYKMSECRTSTIPPTLEDVCSDIKEFTDYYTFFKVEYETVNCKNTFEGIYNFTYEMQEGGGGICAHQNSIIVACQEPGSPYVDNEVFTMSFGKCPEISTSTNQKFEFYCLGSWTDEDGNIWMGVRDRGEDVLRYKYRCLLTRSDQEEGDNKIRYTMSWWADCGELKSPYEGPLRLLLQPIIGGYQLEWGKPTANFPTNYSGHWYHTGEYEVDVDINATHIYMKTRIDRFTYKESYFVALMSTGTRYLTLAITVGKCEIDYVCFDMLPRHHSIIRWRMAKPYRLTDVELAYPDYELYMFRQACGWYSFTIDRNFINWNYLTFLLNPPVPMPCPIRGRYKFVQTGPESELIKTRIRGITERPRHMIDCEEYVTQFQSCDYNPSTIQLDAEYCETVDHTGRPIGEYDEPDWELTCVGHWDEDWSSYMITWDPEDPTSAFRCWNYERTDWRFIKVSRSTSAACLPSQKSDTNDPRLGSSLQMMLEENERLYDDCAQAYVDGDPWISQQTNDELLDFSIGSKLHKSILVTVVSMILALLCH